MVIQQLGLLLGISLKVSSFSVSDRGNSNRILLAVLDVLVQFLALWGLFAIVDSRLSKYFNHLGRHGGTFRNRGLGVTEVRGVVSLIMLST